MFAENKKLMAISLAVATILLLAAMALQLVISKNINFLGLSIGRVGPCIITSKDEGARFHNLIRSSIEDDCGRIGGTLSATDGSKLSLMNGTELQIEKNSFLKINGVIKEKPVLDLKIGKLKVTSYVGPGLWLNHGKGFASIGPDKVEQEFSAQAAPKESNLDSLKDQIKEIEDKKSIEAEKKLAQPIIEINPANGGVVLYTTSSNFYLKIKSNSISELELIIFNFSGTDEYVKIPAGKSVTYPLRVSEFAGISTWELKSVGGQKSQPLMKGSFEVLPFNEENFQTSVDNNREISILE